MSSSGVDVNLPPTAAAKSHIHQQHPKINNKTNNNTNTNKRKSKHDRSGRKRSKSFSGCGLMMNMKPVPPTKFLLGGNITDPLNLNSLKDEEINRAMNAITPKSSPIPTPPRRKGQVEVIIPPNINDPLNLIGCADDAEYEQQLYSPVKKGRKKRLKKKRTISANLDSTAAIELDGGSEAKTPETTSDSAKIPDEMEQVTTSSSDANTNNSSSGGSSNVARELVLELSPKKEKNKRKLEENAGGGSSGGGNEKGNVSGAGASTTGGQTSQPAKKFKYCMDKIVSPVVPQPGAWLKRTNTSNKLKPRTNKTANEQMPQFKDKNKQFQFGNYNRYYGYRNPNNEIDNRLKVFHHHRYLFENKDILDIGCNIGHITLSVARDFCAKSVTGIDIDPKLISIARKNVRNYVKNDQETKGGEGGGDGQSKNVPMKKNSSSEFYPISMPILYGSIDIPGFKDGKEQGRDFPNNVVFKTCNYVLDDDALLALEQPQFDIILCLSITKWIHLNWGDSGIKQAFRRMYAQLRPGGKLILEPQNWASYKSKTKLTEAIFKNYNSIELFPDKFTEYLLSSVVGFAKSEILSYPHPHHHNSKGFRRPIQIFTKSTMFPSERIEATPNNNNITPNINDDALYQRIVTKTDKYESQTPQPDHQQHPNQQRHQIEKHIYTNILNDTSSRFCDESNDGLIGEDKLVKDGGGGGDSEKT